MLQGGILGLFIFIALLIVDDLASLLHREFHLAFKRLLSLLVLSVETLNLFAVGALGLVAIVDDLRDLELKRRHLSL